MKEVKIKKKLILKKINLQVNNGQVLAVLGRNGCGKSTLLNSITNHPITNYTGEVKLEEPVFLGFQKPVEIPELNTMSLLLHLQYLTTGEHLSKSEFMQLHRGDIKELDLTEAILDRPLNTQVSGGENKRIELLQMTVLRPKTVLLDEIDTGLDLDSQILIGNYLMSYIKIYKPAVIIVTHNLGFLNYFKISKVLVLEAGGVSMIGGKEVIKQIELRGFSGLHKL